MKCPTHQDYVFDDILQVLEHMLGHIIDLETHVTHLGEQMTEFADDQAHEDAIVAAEVDALTGLEAWIADLKQSHSSSINFDAADAFVARLKGDTPTPAAPIAAPADVTAPAGDTPIGDSVPTDPAA